MLQSIVLHVLLFFLQFETTLTFGPTFNFYIRIISTSKYVIPLSFIKIYRKQCFVTLFNPTKWFLLENNFILYNQVLKS